MLLKAIVILIAAFFINGIDASANLSISIKGAKFYDANGDQFYIRGDCTTTPCVAYQNQYDTEFYDILIDTSQCQTDAQSMKTLGVNVVRVYSVIAANNHDGCMDAFSQAGIRVLVDLDPGQQTILNNGNPQWTLEQYDAYTQTVSAFAQYGNTMGFLIGNEAIGTSSETNAAPYLKAAVRDVKNFRDSNGLRPIPIGYTAADVEQQLAPTANYLACGNRTEATIDFFGLNSYAWCGNSTFTESGYNEYEQIFTPYNIPVFFSETGCNTPSPRYFTDQAAVFGPDMDSVFSGSVIYQWLEADNSTYGIVTYSGGTSGTPTPLPDYDNLSKQWSMSSPTGTPRSAYSPSLNAPLCPTSGSEWSVAPNAVLPTIAALASASASVSSASAASASAAKASAARVSASATALPSSTSSSALSTSAKVAIGVVIPVVIIATLLLGFLLVRKRRRNAVKSDPVIADEKTFEKAELAAGEGGREVRPKAELEEGTATQRYQLDARIPTELEEGKTTQQYQLEARNPAELSGAGPLEMDAHYTPPELGSERTAELGSESALRRSTPDMSTSSSK